MGDQGPVRWLIAAPLSVSPSGKRIAVSGERFTKVMAKVGPEATVTLATGLGATGLGEARLTFPKPTSFRIADVIAAVPALSQLQAIADRLEKDGNIDSAVVAIRKIVGDGPLLDALEGRRSEPVPVRASAEPPPPAATPSEPAGDVDDPIFGNIARGPEPQADTASQAKGAVSSFIKAMRANKPAPTRTADATPGRQGAPAIKQTVASCAAELLSTEPVATLERAWRSLRMVMAASPGSDDLAVDALDVDHAGLLDALRPRLEPEVPDRPHAVFVVEPVDDVALLGALADLAAEARIPVVVEVGPATVGFDPEAPSDSQPNAPDAWSELRARPTARWLAAAVGSPVVLHETETEPARIVFGGGAAALAAMIAGALDRGGRSFGEVVGKGGALVAPAAHDVRRGPDLMTIPTRTFIAYSTQQTLAERGVIALGSEAGSDRVRLAAAPMVAGDHSLPRTILAGRSAVPNAEPSVTF